MSQPEIIQMLDALDQVMIKDRHRLRRALRALQTCKDKEATNNKKKRGRSRGPAMTLDQARELIESSTEHAQLRKRFRPPVSYPDDLPIAQKRDEIMAAIEKHQIVIVCGETGSGKTTQLPKMMLEMGRGIHGVIGHTQPRRIAARSVAQRIADELHVQLGSAVGYQVRFGDHTDRNTLVKVMTDGILLTETRSDRFLNQYDTIIIDEAHERSLNIDFLLGYLRNLAPRRNDLKIVITSATIDPESFSKHFHNAPIIHVSGRTYPVETRYNEPMPDEYSGEIDIPRCVSAAVSELLEEGPGDILAFFPGEKDIRDCAELLKGQFYGRLEVLPLFARLTNAEQNRVFKRSKTRRIVLSTNVAETSLTVPGIRYVIDTGTARISRFAPRSGVRRLPIEPISQASADQRKGRCGRVGPGICIRLYSEDDFNKRDTYTDPEILRSNLAGVMLQMKALRLGDLEDFPFIDPPYYRAVSAATKELHEIGAMSMGGKLTDIGLRLSRLPIDPRVGRMIIAGHDENALKEVVIIAAALSIRDPRERPLDRQHQADEAHARFKDDQSDFLTLLNIWTFFNEQQHKLSRNQLRRACLQNYLSYTRMVEWRDLVKQLSEVCKDNNLKRNHDPAKSDEIHRALLTGLLSQVGQLDEPPEYKFAGGKKAFIHPGSVMFREKPKWLVSAELVETTKLYARLNARINADWLEKLAGHLIKKHYSDPHYDEKMGHVSAYQRMALYGLTINTRRKIHYGPIEPADSREIFIREALVDGIYQSPGAFDKHNRQLVRELEKLTAKARQHDVMEDIQTRVDFFDQRLPADVYSVKTFEDWREEAEKKDRKLLYMSRDALLARKTDWITKEKYPDRLNMGKSSFKMTYHFKPGDTEDGVTLHVPAVALKQIDPDRLEWLAPGMLEDKVFGLIKSLPKRLRRMMTPTEKWAKTCTEQILTNGDYGKGSLLEKLADMLSEATTYPVSVDDFHPEKLSDYLRMRIVAMDKNNQPVGASRVLSLLIVQVGSGAGTLMGDNEGGGGRRWEKDALTQWDFEDLPKVVAVHRGGARMEAYPTLIDRGSSVSLNLVDHADRARVMHRGGVRRLYMLETMSELEWRVNQSMNLNAVALKAIDLYKQDTLRGDLCGGLAERAFLCDAASGAINDAPRSRLRYEEGMNAGWHRLGDLAGPMCRKVNEILTLRKSINHTMSGMTNPAYQPALKDIKGQMVWLVYSGFVTRTPVKRLAILIKYLQAVEARLVKLQGGGVEKDRQRMNVVLPLWQACKTRTREHHERGVHDPGLETYRWMIEEYRIQQFAQEVGPSMSISSKKLEKQWAMVKR